MKVGTRSEATEPYDRLTAGVVVYFTFVEERGSGWDLLFGAGAANHLATWWCRNPACH